MQIGYLLGLLCLLQVLTIRSIGNHESMTIRKMDVILRILHVGMLSREVTIHDNGSSMFPPKGLHEQSCSNVQTILTILVWVLLPTRRHVDTWPRTRRTLDRKCAWARAGNIRETNSCQPAGLEIAPLSGDVQKITVSVLQ